MRQWHTHTHTHRLWITKPPSVACNWSEHEPQTNEWHDGERNEAFLTGTTNKPFGAKCTLMLEDKNVQTNMNASEKICANACFSMTRTARGASYSHHETRPTLQRVPHSALSQLRHQRQLHTRSLSLALLLLFLPLPSFCSFITPIVFHST